MHENAPCKGCEQRHTACHSHCEKYAQWKMERQKMEARKKEYKLRQREDFLRSEQCKGSKRIWKVGKEHGSQ